MQPFRNYFSGYLSAIREAKDRGASHDYLRSVFIDFARKSFRIDPVDVELEKGVKGATLRAALMPFTRTSFSNSNVTSGQKGTKVKRS